MRANESNTFQISKYDVWRVTGDAQAAAQIYFTKQNMVPYNGPTIGALSEYIIGPYIDDTFMYVEVSAGNVTVEKVRGMDARPLPLQDYTAKNRKTVSQHGIYNLNADTLRVIRSAIADVMSGAARASVALMGTSTFTPNAAGTGSNGWVGAQALGIGACLKRIGRAMGINVRDDNWFGDHKITGSLLDDYDPRWNAHDAAWGPTGNSDQNTLGGDRYRNNTNANNTALRWTPEFAANTIDFYDHLVSSGPTGAIQLSVGGTLTSGVPTGETNLGAALTQNMGGSNQVVYQKTTRTTALAAAIQAFNIKRTAAGAATVYVCGFDLYDSALPDLSIKNMAQSGASMQILAQDANSYNPLQALTIVDPRILVVEGGINDRNGVSQITSSEFGFFLDKIVRARNIANRSVIVMAPPETNPNAGGTYASTSKQDEFNEVGRKVALDNGVIYIDTPEIMGRWSAMNARGQTADDAHMNKSGLMMAARALANVLYG